MLSLIIMRHAKSVDRAESEDDFERGLTRRGQDDARHAGELLHKAGLKADRALVSPARRTLQTWTCIAEAMGNPPVESPMSLYHASEDMLMRALADAFASGARNVVLVGHNPGIGALAHEMARRANALKGWPWGWPTSAVAAFEMEDPGKDLQPISQLLMHNPKA